MPVPQQEFRDLLRGFVAERHDDCSAIEIMEKLCDRLGEFLDENDTSLDEKCAVMCMLLGPFVKGDYLPQFKRDALRDCADAFDLEASWIH